MTFLTSIFNSPSQGTIWNASCILSAGVYLEHLSFPMGFQAVLLCLLGWYMAEKPVIRTHGVCLEPSVFENVLDCCSEAKNTGGRSHSERLTLSDSSGFWWERRNLKTCHRVSQHQEDACYWTRVSEWHPGSCMVCWYGCGLEVCMKPLWWWLVSVQINPSEFNIHIHKWDNINIYFNKMWGSSVFTIFMKYNKC